MLHDFDPGTHQSPLFSSRFLKTFLQLSLRSVIAANCLITVVCVSDNYALWIAVYCTHYFRRALVANWIHSITFVVCVSTSISSVKIWDQISILVILTSKINSKDCRTVICYPFHPRHLKRGCNNCQFQEERRDRNSGGGKGFKINLQKHSNKWKIYSWFQKLRSNFLIVFMTYLWNNGFN